MNNRSSSDQSNTHLLLTTSNIVFTLLCASLVLCAILFGHSAQARNSDFSKPINIFADRTEYDEKTGIQVWVGNVEMSQGTMVIKADRIKITLRDKKLSRIQGTGTPIEFQQENEAGELVTGQANAIDYQAELNSLALSGNATLTQPGQRLQSERIEFDLIKQKVSAEGGNKGRVSIQIQPPTTNKP